MATYIPEGDLFLTCPYDSSHNKIAPKGFSVHVAKCAKNSTKILKTCPFNSTHRIEPVLYEAHLVECKDANPMVVEMRQRELAEWENLDDKKPAASEVAELAGRVEAIGIAGPSNKTTASSWDSDWNSGWDSKPVASGYVIPGLDEPNTQATSAHGENTFHYQMMKPAEKRKLRDRLVQETKDRQREKEMTPILEAKMEQERKEREKREQEKKEEQERYDKMKQEKERIKAAKNAKKKAANEKKKAQRRAAFLASQAQAQEGESKENKENN